MAERFTVVDPDLPEAVAQLIREVPADLLPDPLATDVPERAPWAGPAPRNPKKEGDRYTWLRCRTGWEAARLHRGCYALLPNASAPADAGHLAVRLRQAAGTVLDSVAGAAEAMLDAAEIQAAVPREVYDIALVLQDASAENWPAVQPMLMQRVEQLEALAQATVQANQLAAQEPDPVEDFPQEQPGVDAADLAARAQHGALTSCIALLAKRTREAAEVLGAPAPDGTTVPAEAATGDLLRAVQHDVLRLADRLANEGLSPAAENLLRQAAALLSQDC